jgi:hypothetical protein
LRKLSNTLKQKDRVTNPAEILLMPGVDYYAHLKIEMVIQSVYGQRRAVLRITRNKLNESLIIANTKEIEMSKKQQFTLILQNVDLNTPNLEDSLFEAGCDDAIINFKNGTIYLDFDREGDDFEQAIISAIKDIESANINASVTSVAPEHLVSSSDIADRVSLSKQALSLYILGKRGNNDFPKPILKIHNKSPLWRWSAVAEWFYRQGKIKDHQIIEHATTVEDINEALWFRKKGAFTHRRQILNELGTHLN